MPLMRYDTYAIIIFCDVMDSDMHTYSQTDRQTDVDTCLSVPTHSTERS